MDNLISIKNSTLADYLMYKLDKIENGFSKDELEEVVVDFNDQFIFYDGYIVMFDKVNIHAITSHMLDFCKNRNYLVVLHYDEYYEDDDLFFVDGKKYTLLTIKKYIRNYFKNDSNINVKINNK